MPEMYDITPLIRCEDPGRTAVFPGDTPPSREVLLDMARGNHLTLSSLHATVHLGAHADAPSHYQADGQTMESVPIERFVGRCVVVDADAPEAVDGPGRPRVSWDGLRDPPSDELVRRAPRVLLRTRCHRDRSVFPADYAGLEPSLIERLAAMGATLLGVDTPSVDVSDAKELIAHHACARAGVLIVEGLWLDDVEPGEYELIALPLRLMGFDGSPVRAVLRTLGKADNQSG